MSALLSSALPTTGKLDRQTTLWVVSRRNGRPTGCRLICEVPGVLHDRYPEPTDSADGTRNAKTLTLPTGEFIREFVSIFGG